MHEQADLVRIGQHAGGAHHGAVSFVDGAVAIQVNRLAVGAHRQARGNQVGLPGPDAVGVGLDLGQARGREQCAVVALVARQREVVGLAPRQAEVDAAVGVNVVAIHQLHQPHGGLGAQVAQVAGLEGLDDDRRILLGQPLLRQRGQQAVFQRQAQLSVVRGVFGFGVHADGAAHTLGFALRQRQHFVEGGNRKLSVERLVAVGQRLHGAQGFQLCQREVTDEPAFLFKPVHAHLALAAGEFRAVLHVGGGDDVRLVPRHQYAVLGGHQIGLDEVCAQIHGAAVALQRVVGQVAGGAAVADDQRLVAVQRVVPAAAAAGDQAGGDERAAHQAVEQCRHGVAAPLGQMDVARG